MNPVLWRELRVGARRPRVTWFVTCGVWFCLLVLYLVSAEIGQITVGPGGAARAGRVLVGTLVVTLATVMVFVAPLLAARAMLVEQRRKTFDVLIITPLSARDILRGKLFGALMPLFLVVGATLPLAMVLRLHGGLTLVQVLLGYVFLCLEILVFGQLGAAAAILSGDRRRLGAAMLGVAWVVILVGTPVADRWLNAGFGWWLKLPFVLGFLLWLVGDTSSRLTRRSVGIDDYASEARHAIVFLFCTLLLCLGLWWDISHGGPTLRYFNPLLATADFSGLPVFFEPALSNFGISFVLYLVLPGALFPMLASRLQTYFNTTSPYDRGLFF